MRWKEIVSIPNLLCYVRLLLVGCFLYLYLQDEYVYSACVIALGGITDFLDGQIARRCHMVTDLGKIIDPLADKAMQFAIAVALTTRYPLMMVLLVIFVIKEAFQGICCLLSLKKDRKLDGALWFGKVSTAVFYVLMVILIACVNLPMWFVNVSISITMFFLSFAFVMYAITFHRLFQDK